MAVYYKFKSAKDYDTIPVDEHFISVVALKSRIFEEKRLGRGLPCDLVVTNAQTEEEYKEDDIIPRNTAVSIKRVPRRRGLPIVVTPLTEEPKLELVNKKDVHVVDNGFTGLNSSSIKPSEDTEWGNFGNDIYDIPDVRPPHTSNQVHGFPSPSKVDEERKIQALINTPALDWQFQPTEGYGRGRGFGRKINNRNFGFERITPPPGYVCHRCNTPGHFIQNCPTNGDPNFDIKRAKLPTGIPIAMLKPTPDGSYVLPDGSAGALKPNEDAFEKEIEGLPSTRSVVDFPPELKCPLCKEMMKDAVFTSKCCFRSFCDKCIREYTISKSMCACDARNVVADDLLPNKTLRDTINRMLESNTSISGSAYHVRDMESLNPQAKIRSPTQSAVSKGTSSVQDIPGMVLNNVQPTVAEREKTAKVEDVPEATHVTTSVRETASPESAPLSDEEVQRKPASGDAKEKDVPVATHESVSVRDPAPQDHAPLPDEEAQRKPASGDAKVKDVPEATHESASMREAASQESAPLADGKPASGDTKEKDVPVATHESVSVRDPAPQDHAPLPDEEAQRKPASGDAKVKDVPEATHESASMREAASQESAPLADGKPASGDTVAEMQWGMAQDLAAESYMIPMGPTVYNPHWGMQPGMEGFVDPYAGHMAYMNFGSGPIDVPFGGVIPHDPLFGGQGSMMHFPPQRGLAPPMGFNHGPPPMSREESESHKAEVRKGREIKTRVTESRNLPKEREFGKEVSSSGDISSIEEKCKPILPCSSSEKHCRHQPERSPPDSRSRDSEISRSSKRKSDHDGYHDIRRERPRVPSRNEPRRSRSIEVSDEPRRRARKEDHHRGDYNKSQSSSSALSKPPASKHTKSSAFSDIGFPERGAASASAASKKRKLSSSETPASSCRSHNGSSNSYHEDHHSKTSSKKREAAYGSYESSDDDRHFKRRRFRCEPSPLLPAEWGKERNIHYNKTQLIY